MSVQSATYLSKCPGICDQVYQCLDGKFLSWILLLVQPLDTLQGGTTPAWICHPQMVTKKPKQSIFSIDKLIKGLFKLWKCRKIAKISHGAYIFQRPFLRGLFLEGLIFRGAYVRREICVSKSIGLACSGKEIYHFCFVLLCIWGQFPSTSPRGAYIWRGDLTEGFLRYRLGGLIFGGAYTWRGLFSEFYDMITIATWETTIITP